MTGKLSAEDGALLLQLARETISHELGKENNTAGTLKIRLSDMAITENRGTFVSLHKKGDLRGCIGNIEPSKTIYDGVKDNAKHAAFKDPRFKPLSYDELRETNIEVSILTQPQRLDYTDPIDLIEKLRPGIDGVVIEKEIHRATFLPQVWDQLEDPNLFLAHLCMKAGLSSEEWKSGDLKVLTYQVQLFEEKYE